MAIVESKFLQFKNNDFPKQVNTYKDLSNGQSPDTLFITCSDSRLMPSEITQSKPGELFVIRNAGNLIPKSSDNSTSEALTVEYAVNILKVKEIVVCGHAKCGAMGGILNLDSLVEHKCIHSHLNTASQDFESSLLNDLRKEDNKDKALNELIEKNVETQMLNLYSYDFIKNAVQDGKLEIYGWIYDFVNAEITKKFNLKKDLI